MAYISISSSLIAPGKPVTGDLLTTIKNNEDDLNSRLGTVESAVSSLAPIQFDVQGPGTVVDGVTYFKLLRNITVIGFKLYVWEAGVSGTLTIDVEYKRGAGAWTSILSAPVNAAFSLGDGATVAGSVAVTDLDLNDQIRLNIDAVQASCRGFSVYIENEARV